MSVSCYRRLLISLNKSAINEEGFLSYVGSANASQSLRIIEGASEPPLLIPRGSFLLPAFSDLHLHAPQFLYQGTGLHLPLMEWLDEYAFKAEEGLDADPALARTVYTRLAERLIEHGTGAVLFFGTIKAETKCVADQLTVNVSTEGACTA